MKRTKLIVTMAAMIGAVSLTGCSAKVTIDNGEATNGTSIKIETDAAESTTRTENETTPDKQESTANNSDTIETKAESGNTTPKQEDTIVQSSMVDTTIDWSTTLDSDKEWFFALPADEELAYSFNLSTDETTYQEYATIICQGEKGTYWEYETAKFEVAQCSMVEHLATTANCIYINEGGTVTALNLTDGNILWRNSDYQGSGTLCELDEEGNLYLAGYDSPALVIIDPNGNTLLEVNQFAEYFWPYEMSITDNQLTIKYDCEDNAKVTMDITDHSYTIE